MKQEQEPGRLGAAASNHSRSISTGKVAFSLLFSGVSNYMLAMLAFPELSSASHLRGLCKVSPCSPNNSFSLSCFIPALHACPLSGSPCLPAVPSWGCVPKSVLDIAPFSLGKSSLGPKVTHTLSTSHEFPPVCFAPGLGGRSEWHCGQGWGQAVVRGRALPCLHSKGLSGMHIHSLEKAGGALER